MAVLAAACKGPRALAWFVGVLAILSGTGCGTQGNAEALSDTWPRTPLRGFVLRDAEQPYALLRLGWDLDQPVIAPSPGGDAAGAPLHIWGRMSPRQESEHGLLFRAEVSDLGAAVPPELALTPQGWEGDDLAAPSFLPAEAGRPPVLFYQGGDGSVGLAKLDADGQVQRLTATAPLVSASTLGLGRIGRVYALSAGTTVRLYYIVDSQHVHFAELDAAALARRIAGEPVALEVKVSPPLLWAADFLVKQTAVVMMSAERLDGLSVRRVQTPAGRERYDLYAVAAAMTKAVVVSAASYSGGSLTSTSERFLPVESAALSGNPTGIPSSPAVSTTTGQPMLLLGLHTVETGIAAAFIPHGS